jgi:hypothetical protein
VCGPTIADPPQIIDLSCKEFQLNGKKSYATRTKLFDERPVFFVFVPKNDLFFFQNHETNFQEVKDKLNYHENNLRICNFK